MATSTFCNKHLLSFRPKFIFYLPLSQKRFCATSDSNKKVKPDAAQLQKIANKCLKSEEVDLFQNTEYLTKACNSIFDENKISVKNYEDRKLVVKELAHVLREEFGKDSVKVYSFGSTSSGFGFKDSDLDLTFVPTAKLTSKKVLPKRFLGRAYLSMKEDCDFINVDFVQWARIPIITFKHAITGLNGDLCFSNLLGVYNTILLRRYSEVDSRVQPLTCTVKHLVKQWKICGAKYNYPSSYAYTLMVIHFLQQTEPPVLPSLQNLGNKDQQIIKGCNVCFYNQDVKHVWEHLNSNKENVGELLLSFFDYYNNFNFKKDLVCIKHTNRKRRKSNQKERPMRIVDPFERSRDLAKMVTKPHFNNIKAHFKYASDHFRTLPPPNIDVFPTEVLKEYYFNKKPHDHMKSNE